MNSQLKKNEPVFIVSSGRSGTTLLRAMLNAGNEIMFPHESDFIARAYPFYANKLLDKGDYPILVRFFMYSSQDYGWGMAESELLNEICNTAPRTFADLIELFNFIYLRHHHPDCIRWGNKTPVLIANIDRIYDVFPNAHVVHLVRDGRDVFLSYRTVHSDQNSSGAFGPKGVATAALYWIDGLRRVEAYADRVYELRYEDLLAQPSEVLQKLCKHLGLRFSDAMVEDYGSSSRNKDMVLDIHKKTIHAKLSHGLDRSNTGKYLMKMTRWQRLVFETLTSPYLRKYSYPLEFPLVSSWIFAPLRWAVYVVARLFNNLRYGVRDKTIYAQSKRAGMNCAVSDMAANAGLKVELNCKEK